VTVSASAPSCFVDFDLVPDSVAYEVLIDEADYPASMLRLTHTSGILYLSATFPSWVGAPPAEGSRVDVYQTATSGGASRRSRLATAWVETSESTTTHLGTVLTVTGSATGQTGSGTVLVTPTTTYTAANGQITVMAPPAPVFPGATVAWDDESITAGDVTISLWPGGQTMRVVEAEA
jgi:hypothetical protein